MPGCAIQGCGNHSRKTKSTDVRYYSFPKNEDLCKQWINACQRKDDFNVQQARICSKHFHSSAFHENMKHKLMNYKPKNTRDLKEDAIPTEFLPNPKKTLNTPQAERQDEKKGKILNERARPLNYDEGDIYDRSAVPCSIKVSEKSSLSALKMDIEIKTEPALSTDCALHTYDEEGCETHDVKIEDVNTYEQFIDEHGIHDRRSWIVKRENEELDASYRPIDRDLVIGVDQHEQEVAADSKIYGSEECLGKILDNV